MNSLAICRLINTLYGGAISRVFDAQGSEQSAADISFSDGH